MFERNDDVLYICYDNEAYMNTGVQRSSATPPAARTATTTAVGAAPGAEFGKGKNVPMIALAHEIPYVATATVADLHDLEAKVERAMAIRGARYIHILVPVPARLGRGEPRHDQARAAGARDRHLPGVRGRARRDHARREDPPSCPVDAYLRPQKRFAHLFGANGRADLLARIQQGADRNIRRFRLLDEESAA
jgi:pyruvate ferredoxin oxidoreductase beta subunit